MEGQVRVVSDSLGTRVKLQIPSDHNRPAWLVEFGQQVVGRCAEDVDRSAQSARSRNENLNMMGGLSWKTSPGSGWRHWRWRSQGCRLEQATDHCGRPFRVRDIQRHDFTVHWYGVCYASARSTWSTSLGHMSEAANQCHWAGRWKSQSQTRSAEGAGILRAREHMF